MPYAQLALFPSELPVSLFLRLFYPARPSSVNPNVGIQECTQKETKSAHLLFLSLFAGSASDTQGRFLDPFPSPKANPHRIRIMEGDQSEPPPPVPAGAPPPPEGSGPPTPLMPHPLSSPSRQSSGSQPGPGLLRSPTGSPTMGPPPPLQGMGNMGGPMHGPPQILQRPMQHGGMGGMGMQGGGPAFLAPFDQRPPPLPIGQGRFPLSMRMMGMNMPGPMGMNMPPPSGMKMPGPMRPGGMPGPPPAPMILGSIPPRGPPLPPPPPGGMGMGGPGAGGILPPSPYPSPSSSASPYASSSPRPSRGTNFRNRQPGSATRGPRSSKDARVYDSKFYTMEKSSSSSGKDGEFISLFAPEDEALRATTCHKGRVWKENRLRDD
eukprot:Cvel_26141.t1-p1 / transcript=Cvel_26141.t1 / gene=Cvel_26141 / organism=Chromera_velia_CCMP2878 / gene_product=hypothetical protein / transcript_product=hypothetical protein / location=Cvel_scaffold3063:149-1284(-) / protein_length=378 / sequence_SO=supercontig / SO=protein_coding / is_pseudo=false